MVTESGRRLLSRAARHQQITQAATRAFAHAGFAATSLDDVAAEAGITKAIIYRHFDSKATLYTEALQAVRGRIRDRVGSDEDMGPDSLRILIDAAAEDSDGYQLLFDHARREPDFRMYSDEFERESTRIAAERLEGAISDPAIRAWIARTLVRVQTEMILGWLRADRPVATGQLAAAIQGASRNIVAAAAAQ